VISGLRSLEINDPKTGCANSIGQRYGPADMATRKWLTTIPTPGTFFAMDRAI
jgi:hypothetical protein